MQPIEQTCPTCGIRFMGSDAIGYPCLDCSVIDRWETNLGRELTEDEKAEVRNVSFFLDHITTGEDLI